MSLIIRTGTGPVPYWYRAWSAQRSHRRHTRDAGVDARRGADDRHNASFAIDVGSAAALSPVGAGVQPNGAVLYGAKNVRISGAFATGDAPRPI